MRVITISGKARSGKTTIANALKEKLELQGMRVKIVNFADYLKMILKEYYGWNGEKDEKGRKLLQEVGTDIMRKNNENIWVRVIIELLKAFGDTVDVVIIPDTRFKNEIVMLRDCPIIEGPFTVRVEREGDYSDLTEEQKRHPSETALDDWKFDLIVKNDKDLRSFLDKSDNIITLFDFDQKKRTPTI